MVMQIKLDRCVIKGCKFLPESIKAFGLELCFKHQDIVAKWLYAKGYEKKS